MSWATCYVTELWDAVGNNDDVPQDASDQSRKRKYKLSKALENDVWLLTRNKISQLARWMQFRDMVDFVDFIVEVTPEVITPQVRADMRYKR